MAVPVVSTQRRASGSVSAGGPAKLKVPHSKSKVPAFFFVASAPLGVAGEASWLSSACSKRMQLASRSLGESGAAVARSSWAR
eukprot:scaffold24168_cov63-Phaeocystis_antarctica.AAC.2